jgi:hypothetical protein
MDVGDRPGAEGVVMTCPRVVGATSDGKQLLLCGQVLDEQRCCPIHGGPAVVFIEPRRQQ